MELFIEPIVLTSLKSDSQTRMLTAYGPGERNCVLLSTRNGTALPTHGVGSQSGLPPASASGCHTPGSPDPNAHRIGTRPSWPSSSIVSAASAPTPSPSVLDEPSGTAAS